MDSEQLKDILTKHRAWVNAENGGVHADLSGADLRGADLSEADLRLADLSEADLRGADLSGADLRGADLSGADLRGADLSEADLRGANLRGADLSGADLRGADLSEADLRLADLRHADLNNISFNSNTVGFILACPEIGSFTAFKKVRGCIVVLEIPADAQRSSATTLKCRCDKAKVLRIENLDGSIPELTSVPSNYDKNFIYTVGKTVCVDDFDTERWNECSRGIHFFLSRALAVQY